MNEVTELEEIELDEEGVQELTDKYGEGYVTCSQCNSTTSLKQVVDSFVCHVQQTRDDPAVLFHPETLEDLLYRVCEDCGKLSKHTYSQNLEDNAEGIDKPLDSKESNGFQQPFSI